jgi:hypothetical protein
MFQFTVINTCGEIYTEQRIFLHDTCVKNISYKSYKGRFGCKYPGVSASSTVFKLVKKSVQLMF